MDVCREGRSEEGQGEGPSVVSVSSRLEAGESRLLTPKKQKDREKVSVGQT